jgi:hypothetical protein
MQGSDGQQRALFLLMALANGKPLGALTLMQAAGHLREHGKADAATPLRLILPLLPLLPGLRDCRTDVADALQAIMGRSRGDCRCVTVALGKTPANAAGMVIVSKQEEPYLSKTVVECPECLAQWQVDEEDSYHYPIVTWTRVTSPNAR